MGVEKMSGIYIPGAKIPDGEYVRVLMLHKDGTCVDGIGNVFKVVPVPPHGDLIERDKLREKEFIHDGDAYAVVMSRDIRNAPTIIPAEPPKEE